MTDVNDRPPWYERAFQLFAHEHFDSDNAAMLARSEWQQQQLRALDANEPERPIPMVGHDWGARTVSRLSSCRTSANDAPGVTVQEQPRRHLPQS